MDGLVSAAPAELVDGWITLERSVLVNAPAECVESLLIDFRAIYANLQDIQFDNVFPDVGGVLSYRVKLGGLATIQADLRIIEWKPGFIMGDVIIQGIRWTGTGHLVNRESTKGMVMWHIASDARGAVVTGRYQYEQPGAFHEQILEQRIVRHHAGQSLENALAAIKRMAEKRLHD
jgi:hypothetical protein